MSHLCDMVVISVACSRTVVEESSKMPTRNPFERFIQDELFNDDRQPTCENIHPLIDLTLQSLDQDDLESLDAFRQQFASCLPKALFTLGMLDIDPIMVGTSEDADEEDLLLALPPDELFALLERCIRTAQFLEPVIRQLFNRRSGDDADSADGDHSALAS